MKLGFIGVGNMGGTLAAVAAKAVGAEHLLVSSRTIEKAEEFAEKLGCRAVTNQDIAKQAAMIFLGVKPQKLEAVLAELQAIFAARSERVVLVSMAAGVTTQQVAAWSGGQFPVLRIMPNTPSAVGEGMIQFCGNDLVTEEDQAYLQAVLAPAGRVVPLAEHLMDAASAVSGCGPAFVCLFIEAMADAGVACGLPRATALEYAAQTLLGTAKLVLETGTHPAALKDAVCSPAGSTIAGVAALEAGCFRSAVQKAVKASFERTRELGK